MLYKDCYWTNTIPKNLEIKYKINPCLTCDKYPKNTKSSIKVYQYDLNGKFVREFISTSEADRYFGAKSYGAVSSAAREGTNNKTAYGYMWRYVKQNQIDPYINNSSKSKNVGVYVFNIFSGIQTQYESIAAAVKSIGTINFNSDCAAFSSCCKDGLIYKNKYAVSYTEKFKLTTRKTIIYNTFQNKFYSNAKIAAKENSVSVWRIKRDCIDQNNVEWIYVVDSARVKLGESGKLLT